MSVSAAAASKHTPDRLALTAFACAVVIGGSNFVAVRFSNRELDPRQREATPRFDAILGVDKRCAPER